MNKKIIIIAGYCAAGKSTFALRLSKEINVPYLMKDTFKTAICTGIKVANRDEGTRFSAATFDAIAYVTERFMETGCPLIIEGNFVLGGYMKTNEANVLKSLIDHYNYQSLTYLFLGDLRILHKRFIEREKLPERGQANQIFGEFTYEDFVKSISPLGEFTVSGEIVKIDTTDFGTVDFVRHIERARLFIESEGQR